MNNNNKNNMILFDLLNPAESSMLSNNAEILARRLLDLLWISSTGMLTNNQDQLYRAIGKGFSKATFKKYWLEILKADPFLFRISEGGKVVYCKSMLEYIDKRNIIAERRSKAGRKGGKIKRDTQPSKPVEPSQKRPATPMVNTSDERGSINSDPGRRSDAGSKNSFFDQIKAMNSDNGLSTAAKNRLKRD